MTPRTPRHRRRLQAASGALLLAILAPVVGPAQATAAHARPTLRQFVEVDAPRDLRVLKATTTSATVAWSRPRGAKRFRLVRSEGRGMTAPTVAWTGRTRVRITGLEPGSTYFVRVRVVNGRHPLSSFSRTVPVATEPVADTEPTDPTEPTEPTEPTVPTVPTVPTDPTEPTVPTDPTEPTVPTVPTDPTEPTVPTVPTDPGTPEGTTLFGANYTTNSLVDEGLYAGRASVARVFFQGLGGVRFVNNSAVREARADGVDTFVISWKETNPDAIRTFLAGIPDELTIYTSFNHEPENDHGNPGSETYRAWSQEYRRQWALQSPLMRAEGFIPTNILMAWTLQQQSGRTVAEWTPPAGTVDVFAFDAYYGQGKDPVALAERMAEAARDAGVVRTGLAETGAPTADGNRLANTAKMRRALLAEGVFEWGIYWNSAENGYDSRMDVATADAWFGR